MASLVQSAAADGLRQSRRVPWEFWHKTRIRTERAEEALDRIAAMVGPDSPEASEVRLARAAEPAVPDAKERLAVLQQALSDLSGTVANDVGGLGALACHLMQPATSHEPVAVALLHQLTEETKHRDATTAAFFPYLQDLAAAGHTATWALAVSVGGVPAAAAGWAALALNSSLAVTRTALQDIARLPNLDAGAQSQIARRGELQALKLSEATRQLADFALLQSLAKGDKCTPQDACAFAACLAAAVPQDATPLASWSLSQTGPTASGTAADWISYRNKLASRVPQPAQDAVAVAVMNRIASGAPADFSQQAAVALEAVRSCAKPDQAAAALDAMPANDGVTLLRTMLGQSGVPVDARMAAATAGLARLSQGSTGDAVSQVAAAALDAVDDPEAAIALGQTAIAAFKDAPWLEHIAKATFVDRKNQADVLKSVVRERTQGGFGDLDGMLHLALVGADRATGFYDKAFVAESALAWIPVYSPTEETDALLAARQAALPANDPQGWFRAATDLASLEALGGSLRSTPETLAARFVGFLSSPWLTSAQQTAMGTAFLNGLEKAAPDRFVPALIRETRQEMAAATEDGPRVKALLHGLVGIASSGSNSLFRAAQRVADASATAVQEGDGSLSVGSLTLQGSAPAPAPPPAPTPPPVITAPVYDTSLASHQGETSTGFKHGYKTGIVSVYNPASGQFVDASGYKSGEAQVYNPETGQVESQQVYKSGVAGVWNPCTHQVEWQNEYKSGVAGVFNPWTQQTVWIQDYKSGVGVVYNPQTHDVVSNKSYKDGVAGVYNPITHDVQWETDYKSGVAGFFDGASRQVTFEKGYKEGVSAWSNDPGNPVLAASSTWYPLDDDDE